MAARSRKGRSKRKATRKGRRGGRKFRAGRDRTGGLYGRFEGKNELKYFDTSYSAVAGASTGVQLTCPLVILGGSKANERVGRKICVKSMELIGCLRATAATTLLSNMSARLLVVIDKQYNGAAAGSPAFTEIMLAGVAGELPLTGLPEMANSERFRVLKDMKFLMKPQVQATAGPPATYNQYRQKFSIKKKLNLPIEFRDETADVTKIQSNNILFYLITQTADCVIDAKCRVRYSDN